MFINILRKMLRNRWMTICLMLGCLLAVTTISCIPVYSNSIFQRMLMKDLENYQVEENKYPGDYLVSGNFSKEASAQEILATYNELSQRAESGEFASVLSLPVLEESVRLIAGTMDMLPDLYTNIPWEKRSIRFAAMEGIGDHVTLVSGELPSSERKDGVIEVMVAENAVGSLSLSTGSTAVVTASDGTTYQVVVTGVFRYTDSSDLYWPQAQTSFEERLVMDSSLFETIFLEEEGAEHLYSATWHYAFDYTKMKVQNASAYSAAINAQKESLPEGFSVTTEIGELLGSYSGRMSSLSFTLWILQVPVILMLLLYVFMVSKLIVDYDANDISVQKSRGASNFQIFTNYLLEGGVLGAIALLIGPLLGWLVCGMLGLSDGFLEFVSRKGLQVEMVPDAYLYALLAIVVFLITMLVPVMLTARSGIVRHKRSKSRSSDKPVWKKFYLDVVLLGVSVYGYFSYRNNLKMLDAAGLSGSEAYMDPALFLLSALAILSAALLFLRLYPLLIRLVFRLGRKHWKPGTYASLLNVSRTRSSHFLMVFLIMTVSLGIFDAVSARTINTFTEDHIYYSNGADIVLSSNWTYESVKVMYDDEGNMVPYDEGSADYDATKVSEIYYYNEPDFVPYTQLDTIDVATKVFRDKKTSVTCDGGSADGVTLMGVIPHEFGQVAWSRSDLLPAHINEYLNIMTDNPTAVFVSRALAEQTGINPGDKIEFAWSGQSKALEAVVCGIIDYWPTINPNAQESGENDLKFMVANLKYIHAEGAVRPYEIWMSRADGATSEMIYAEFEEKGIKFDTIVNTEQDLVAAKNDPMLQGINGTLTLGFVIIMAITLIGFLIYWIFNIRGRTLQFGILRAMGLSKRQLIGMILWEQLLISGVAILAGILIGSLAANLFVPLLQMIYTPSEQVPPFKVVAYFSDYLRLFVVLLIMLVAGSAVLARIISRIKMDQALKLGED